MPNSNHISPPQDLTARLRTTRDLGPDELLRRAGPILASCVLPFGLILYLSLAEGGYEAIARSEAGIAIWWILLVGAAIGVLPTARTARTGWVFVGLLAAFAVWTGIGIAWSESAERSVAELARVITLLGVFVLALATQGPDSARRVAGAVATAIVVVAVLALGSRLHPSWFPANEVAESLPTEQARLSYPLTYWNGNATLIAIGMPLLLWTATAARTLTARALSVAALPLLGLVIYYTISRGGAAQAAIAVAVLVALHPQRLRLILPVLIAAGGARVLISAASAREELADGLTVEPALGQGDEMLLIALAVCAVCGALAVAVAIAERRGRIRAPEIRRGTAIRATAIVAAVAAVGAIAVGAPGELSDRWESFKEPVTPGADADRFSSVSGSGRYQWWESAVDAGESEPLTGIGPGTWEYWWARGDGGIPGFVRESHSLYLEVFGELGILGFLLITGFVLGLVGVGVKRSLRGRGDLPRTELLAATTAALAAFAVAAAVDWSWELTVLPVAFLLLGATLLGRSEPEDEGRRVPAGMRPALAGLSVIAIALIAVPMLSDRSIERSKDQVDQGLLLDALESARSAEDLMPLSATPNVQEALVLQLGGNLIAAEEAALEATEDEPTNWRNWLTLSEIQEELGDAVASEESYERARALNPRSPLFAVPSD